MSSNDRTGKLVACVSYALQNPLMLHMGVVVCAHGGMEVRKSPEFPEGKEAGRVGTGVGIVLNPNGCLGNLVVRWPEDGDYTLWTRAGAHGFDVVLS